MILYLLAAVCLKVRKKIRGKGRALSENVNTCTRQGGHEREKGQRGSTLTKYKRNEIVI